MNIYSTAPSADERITATILILYGILLLGVGLVWLAGYIFQTLGTYTLAKKQNLASPYLAWIPYARTYLLGLLCGELTIGKRKMRSPGLWLLLLPLLLSALLTCVVIAYIVSLFITTFSLSVMFPSEEEMIAAVFGLIILWIVILAVVSVIVQAVTYWITLLVRVNIYKKYTEDNMALTHGVLSLFIPLYAPIYLFVLSRKAPQMTPVSPTLPYICQEESPYGEEN